MTKISIITATFNAANTLRDCLECVKGQSVEVEHILVDGGSTDGTLTIAEEYPHLAGIISEPDKGIYDAMNKGLKIANRGIVGILNADDFYPATDTLEKVTKAFSDPAVGACYGDLLYVDGNDTEKVVRNWQSGEFRPAKFYWGWMPPHPTFFVRCSVYEQYGLFNLGLGSAADYEIMLRFLLRHKIKTAYIPEVLVRMRTGGRSNATFAKRLAANRMDKKAWEVNGLQPYPWTMWLKPLRKVSQWFCK